MTSAQVIETLVNVTPNSPAQDYTHPDDHNYLPVVKRTSSNAYPELALFLVKHLYTTVEPR